MKYKSFAQCFFVTLIKTKGNTSLRRHPERNLTLPTYPEGSVPAPSSNSALINPTASLLSGGRRESRV